MTALKVALVVFLVVGVIVLVVSGLRRSRANRKDPQWSQPYRGQPGHLASILGTMPRTPLPDYVVNPPSDEED